MAVTKAALMTENEELRRLLADAAARLDVARDLYKKQRIEIRELTGKLLLAEAANERSGAAKEQRIQWLRDNNRSAADKCHAAA